MRFTLLPNSGRVGKKRASLPWLLRFIATVLLAVFWKKGRGLPVITGMICSLAVMISISPLVQEHLPASWPRLSLQIAFPWYTLIGCMVMVAVAWGLRAVSETFRRVLQSGRRG